MNTYNLKIQADNNQITLFAIDKGWQAQIQDPDDIKRIEAEMAAFKLDNNVVVDPIIKTIDNPISAEVFAKEHMRNLVATELKNSALKYYETLSRNSLKKLLKTVNEKMENQVSITTETAV